jgi:hypothetical protein
MSYGFGYRPDSPYYPKTPFHRLAAKFSGAPANDVDLRPFAPAVKDQDGTSSCTGHGTSTAISTAFRKSGTPLPFEPSEKGIYDLARCIDRMPKPDGRLPPLTDDGAMPNQVMRGIGEWGIRPRNHQALDGRNSDCEPSTINREPTFAELETDAVTILLGCYAIRSTGSQRVSEIKQALSNGLPVCVGAFVDTAFMRWDPKSGPIGAPNWGDPDGGGHWLCALGHSSTYTGKTAFIVRNSWGTGWGSSGDCEVSEDFIANLYDIDVIVPRKAA